MMFLKDARFVERGCELGGLGMSHIDMKWFMPNPRINALCTKRGYITQKKKQ